MNNELRQRVGDLLIDFGISPSYTGFNFIIDSVEIFAENPNIKGQDIYEILAIRYKCTSSYVHKSIINAFSKLSEHHKISYFGNIKYSNMGYISTMAWKERLRNG